MTNSKEYINENKNPQKIRKYTQLTLKSIFSKNQLKEYLKNTEEKCVKIHDCGATKTISQLYYMGSMGLLSYVAMIQN